MVLKFRLDPEASSRPPHGASDGLRNCFLARRQQGQHSTLRWPLAAGVTPHAKADDWLFPKRSGVKRGTGIDFTWLRSLLVLGVQKSVNLILALKEICMHHLMTSFYKMFWGSEEGQVTLD